MNDLIHFGDYKTDKGPDGHSYQRAYDLYFGDRRLRCENIVEIGTRKGSIKLWLDYFPQTTLYGWDLKDPKFSDARFKFMKVNQSSDDEMRNALETIGRPLDVIIDDGPHTPKEQTRCFELAFPRLAHGGIYVMEDLHSTDPENELPDQYRRNMNGADFSFRQILSRLESGMLEPTMYLRNPKSLSEEIQSIHVECGDTIRWKKFQKTPSDIAFVIRK
ncbi:MAG: class I SAM-dependent methyltransferase [Pseudomonadota bacterium]